MNDTLRHIEGYVTEAKVKKLADAAIEFLKVGDRARRGELRLHGRAYKNAIRDLREAYAVYRNHDNDG